MALALTIGPRPGVVDVEDHVLATAWAAYGALLMDGYGPSSRPWGWWAFEPGVPDELRGERPQLVPVEDGEQDRAKRADLEVRRAAWLAATGAGGFTT